MTETYPFLASMGVKNPEQIESYTVYQSREDLDILRLIYKRPKGSFLPITRKYKFGRGGKSQTVDSGTRKTVLIYEISPQLVNATQELDRITETTRSRQQIKEHFRSELKRIQNDFKAETDALLDLIDELGD